MKILTALRLQCHHILEYHEEDYFSYLRSIAPSDLPTHALQEVGAVLLTVIKNLIIDLFQFFPGIVLSAFYYGYIVTQLPGGILARKFGGATILGLSVGTSGALTMLTPLAAHAHVGVLIALRVVIGMAEVTNI